MTTPPILPVTYCGSIDYYILLTLYDEVCVEVNESFAKQTLRNRCTIYSANGLLDLVIPVKHSGSRLISEIQPDNSIPWQRQHWYAIRSAYARSPFYEFYAPGLHSFYDITYNSLVEYNLLLCGKICELIGISSKIYKSENYQEYPTPLDYRNQFKPSKKNQLFSQTYYLQTFNEKHGYIPNLSILDLLFNIGPNALEYLQLQSPGKKIHSL